MKSLFLPTVISNTKMSAHYHILVKNDLDQAVCVLNESEKLAHLLYLKSFRTEACQKFREHRCVYHKPYTCFNWHFPNQRRRRPFRLKNGQFNYSSDVYCNQYDENAGYCRVGDSCFYLHKNAGDTERRYHLRYFRTLVCNNELDFSGKCVRNGRHCAFAHGLEDLRQPVYDIRELAKAAEFNMNLPAILEKERILSEDPNWNNLQFVLLKYKTNICMRSSRMCRQGYACPYYHNSKDKRRNPLINKYRSTPCSIVKFNEEWGDPLLCEMEDECVYCHTRTEQQFHPEIYKSTKCNDMLHLGYCPRGPFCAFAHVEAEINFGRECLCVDEINHSIAQLSLEYLAEEGCVTKAPADVVAVICTTGWEASGKTWCSNGELVSSLSSLYWNDTPPRFRRISPCCVESASCTISSIAAHEDDLDLEDVMQSFTLSNHDVTLDKNKEEEEEEKEEEERGVWLDHILNTFVSDLNVLSTKGYANEVHGIPLFPTHSSVDIETLCVSTLPERRVLLDQTNSDKRKNPEAYRRFCHDKSSLSASAPEFVMSTNVT